MDMIKDEKRKVWLSLMVIFTFGALTVNAVWVYYYNKIDQRHVAQIDEFAQRMEAQDRSYKYQLGQMRNRVEKKVDQVLSKLDKMPPHPVVIDVKREIEKVRSD